MFQFSQSLFLVGSQFLAEKCVARNILVLGVLVFLILALKSSESLSHEEGVGQC